MCDFFFFFTGDKKQFEMNYFYVSYLNNKPLKNIVYVGISCNFHIGLH